MSLRAADSFADIRTAIDRIRRDQTPMCPRAASKTLFDCLRESVRCPDGCAHYQDWIGPEGAAKS